jgi:hypothetical protein
MEVQLAGPFAAHSPQPHLAHRGEFAMRLERLLVHQARYLVSTLHPWEHDERIMLLTGGGSTEHHIRPNSHTAFGLAVLYRLGSESLQGEPAGLSPELCRERAIAILRFLLPRHGAGGEFCKDGKQWKNQWQSAHWAHSAGLACWMLWDELEPQMQWLAARMVCDEADRFVGQTPPTQVQRDTKAEENAWNSQVIALAYNMFPQHPHHEAWGETAIRWATSAFAREADLERENLSDGRPLREWLSGANIHDDFTLENHDRVHPDYMTTITMPLYLKQLYEWSGTQPPEGLELNTAEIYQHIKRLSFADGSLLYPNGQDWHLRRTPQWLYLHAIMAFPSGDAQAARLFQICLETSERMAARQPRGGIHIPDESFFPSTQHALLEGYSHAYLWLRSHGEAHQPIDETRLWQQLSGLHRFDNGRFAMLRTPRSVATFSWGRRVMGSVQPLRRDLLPTPYERSLVGSVGAKDLQNEMPDVRQVAIAPFSDTFAISGILDRAAGAIEQRFAFVALPDGRALYADVLSAVKNVPAVSLDLGTLGVLNEANWVYHNGRRTLHYEDGIQAFTALGEDEPPRRFRSDWYNLDDALGVVCLAASGEQEYIPNHKPHRSRLEQLFHLNHHAPVDARRGEKLAEGLFVFYPDQVHEQTRIAAVKCRLDRGPHDAVTVHLDDGREVVLDLNGLTVNINPSRKQRP